MKTLLKILGVIAGIFIILILVLKLYFTDQRLKSMIMPKVDDALGRKVQVDHLSLTFFETFPHIGLSMKGLTIPGEHRDTLASLKDLVVAVKLFPLISKKVDISNVELISPKFIYRVDRKGATNLDQIMKKFSSGEVNTSNTSPSTTSGGAPAISIKKFTIKNAHFGYVNFQDTSNYQVNNLNADISLDYASQIDSKVNVTIGGVTVEMHGVRYLKNLPMSLKQESMVDMAKQTVNITDGSLSIRGLSLEMKGNISNWGKNEPDVNLQISSSSDNFGELLKMVPASYKKQIEGLETHGKLTLNGDVKGKVGGKKLPYFQFKMAVENGFVKNPDLKEPIKNIQISLDANNYEIKLTRFNAEAGTNKLSSTGVIVKPLEDNATFNFKLNGNMDLASIKDFYPIGDTLQLRGQFLVNTTLQGHINDLKHVDANGEVKLDNGFIKYKRIAKPIEDITVDSRINGNRIDIKKIFLKTGTNTLSANGTVSNYLSGSPDIDIKVNTGMNLAEITDYYSLKKYVKQFNGHMNANLAVVGPVKNWRKMKFTGGMDLNKVNVAADSLPQPIKNMNVNLNFSQSSVELHNLSMMLGSSDIKINGRMDNYMAMTEKVTKGLKPARLSGHYYSHFFDADEWISKSSSTTADTAAVPITLPYLDSSLSAKIDSLVMKGIPVTHMEATLKTTPKMVEMPKGQLHLFGGEVQGAFTWHIIKPTFTHVDFTGKLTNLSTRKFFKEYHVLGKKSEFYKYVTGNFSADAVYKTDLDKTLSPVIKSSNSKGTFGMTDVHLKDSPIQNELAKLLNDQSFRDIVVDNWKADFTIKDGILTLHNVKLTHKDVGMEMDGTQNLINDQIDYRVKLILPSRFAKGLSSIISKQAVEALTRKDKKIVLPLVFRGTTSKPRIGIDESGVKKSLENFLKNDITKKLKGLFDKIKH